MIWINGEFRDDSHAHLSWSDPGFVSGATVVDNCRTWGDLLYRWSDHFERFASDCEACFIEMPYDETTLETAANRLCEGHQNQHVITFATPDTVGMMAKPVDQQRNRRLYRDGARLVVAGHFQADSTSILPPQIKHRSRMHWHVANEVVKRKDRHAMAILVDSPGGTLTEAAIGNLLAVTAGRIVSPPRERILDGIGLRVALEFCQGIGIEIEEREMPMIELGQYSEVMMIGSGFGICGVASVDEYKWPVPGPVTQQLMAAWASAVDMDLK